MKFRVPICSGTPQDGHGEREGERERAKKNMFRYIQPMSCLCQLHHHYSPLCQSSLLRQRCEQRDARLCLMGQKLVLAELSLDTAQQKTTLQHLGHAVCLRRRDPAMSMSSPCQKRCPYVQLGHMPRFHNGFVHVCRKCMEVWPRYNRLW